MTERSTLAGIGAGVAAVIAATCAVITSQGYLVVAAAALVLLCLGLLLSSSRRRSDHHTQSELAAQAEALAQKMLDQVAARAARFEAEAISARAQLAQAMRAERAAAAAAPAIVETIDVTTPDRPVEAPEPAPVASSDAMEGSDPDDANDPITDPATGLFSAVFFDASLKKRISASRRGLRPLTVAIAEVVSHVGTPEQRPADAAAVARTMLAVFREADTLAHGDDDLYLVLLEDTPENGAIWTLERLRRRIAEELPGHTLRVGVSCYPAYGFDDEQLMRQATDALEAAREWKQDRIEVTAASPDD
jgi:GGDEF domain-containing protein